MPERTVMVVQGSIGKGHCRDCNAKVVWATTASRKGKPARNLPFDAPPPVPLSVHRNDETGVLFEVWPTSRLHFTTCPARPPRAPRGGTR